MSWSVVAAVLLVAWLLWTAWGLFYYYREARKTGLPYVVSIWDNFNPIFMVASIQLQPVLQKYLPESWYHPFDVATYGFEFRNKWSLHARHGQVFMLVTPGHNEINIADPELAVEVLKRINDFPAAEMAAMVIEVFGPGLVTSNGDNWARQRRLIAPLINEKISGRVFDDSCRQAREMMAAFAADSADGVTDEAMPGLKTIAINVLSAVGFGVPLPWKQDVSKPPAGQRITFRKAITTVIERLVEVAVFPTWFFLLPVFPESWRSVGHAKNEFPVLTKVMLEEERRRQQTSDSWHNNLLSILVRLADANAEERIDRSKLDRKAEVLTEPEILGNLFVFTIAGFDTTANTMSFALALLALYPEWQAWLFEELDAVLADTGVADVTDPAAALEYARIFPRLPRTLAVMMETLRLFPPLTHINKQVTKAHDVDVRTPSGTSYLIPRGTTVYINMTALHQDPSVWGADAAEFRPSRWFPDSKALPTHTMADYVRPPPGSFVAWSTGPRICPGMKMAQVEFTSVFMIMFAKYRVEPVRKTSLETEDEMRVRWETMLDQSRPKLTLEMPRPKDFKVRWVQR